MGASDAIRAGAAYVEAFLDDNKLVRGLKAADAKLHAWGASVSKVGVSMQGLSAALQAPFVMAAKSFADGGSELADMSARTGISANALAELGFMAGQTGSDLGAVESAVKRMQKTMMAGTMESVTAESALAALGLQAKDLQKLSPEVAFMKVAGALSRIPNASARAGAAMGIFGKEGTALLPMIRDFDELRGQVKEFGTAWDQVDVNNADALGDATDILAYTMTRLYQVVGAAVAPVLTQTSLMMARMVKTVTGWINANRPLISMLYNMAWAVGIVGTGLVALGVTMAGLGTAFGIVATLIGAVGSVIVFLVSPIGMVIAAVVALGYAFVNYTTLGGELWAWLGDQFAEFAATSMAAFKGIADALRAGDIVGAGRTMWAYLKVEWIKGLSFLRDYWGQVWDGIVNAFGAVSSAIATMWVDVWNEVQRIAAGGYAYLMQGITSVSGFFLKVFIGIRQYFEEMWAYIRAAFGSGTLEADLKAIAAKAEAQRQAQDQGTAQQLADQRAAREKERAEADAAWQVQLDSIKDQQAAAVAARKEARDKIMADEAAALAKAQGELDASIKDNAAKAAGIGAPGAKGQLGTGEFNDPAAGLDKSKQKVDAKGTFSAFAARGFGAGDTLSEGVKDMKKEQAKGNKHLEKISERIGKARMAYQP